MLCVAVWLCCAGQQLQLRVCALPGVYYQLALTGWTRALLTVSFLRVAWLCQTASVGGLAADMVGLQPPAPRDWQELLVVNKWEAWFYVCA